MLSIMPTERRTSPRIWCCLVQGQARGIGGAEGIERAVGKAVPDHLLVEVALLIAVGNHVLAVVQADFVVPVGQRAGQTRHIALRGGHQFAGAQPSLRKAGAHRDDAVLVPGGQAGQAGAGQGWHQEMSMSASIRFGVPE
jgi:hypothetical protein